MSFPGIGERVGARFMSLGYWKNDRPEVARFCEEKGYRPQYVYAWLKNRTPTFENLNRLARDLEVSPTWILFGSEAVAAEAVATAEGARVDRVGSVPARRPIGMADSSVRRHGTGARSVVDFTRVREAAERLLELEAELEAIFAAFPDVYLSVHADGTVRDYRPGRGFSLPVPEQEIIDRPIYRIFEPKTGIALQRAIATVMRTNEPVVSVDCEFLDGDERKSYEARVVPVRKPRGEAEVMIIIRNVTGLRHAERELRDSEARYRQLVEGSPNGMCIHRDFVVEYANRTMARFVGARDPSDIVGKDLRSFIAPADRETFERVHDRRGGRVRARNEFRGLKADGSLVPFVGIISDVGWGGVPSSLVTMQLVSSDTSTVDAQAERPPLSRRAGPGNPSPPAR